MNNYAIKPGVMLYNYAYDRCYLVLERFINLPETWRCIYREKDGKYRIYYITEKEIELTQDGVWKVLSGIGLSDVYLNSIVHGGGSGFETLKKTFDLADNVVMKMKYNNEKKENLADDSMKKFFGDLLMNENKKENA